MFWGRCIVLGLLTRQMGARLVVSDDLIEAARARGADPRQTLQDLRREDPVTIRGRREPVAIWTAGRPGV